MARKLSKKARPVKKIIKKITPVVAVKAKEVVPALPVPTGKYFEGVGRRKSATARVRIYEGGADFIVNGQVAGQYFAMLDQAQSVYLKPLDLVESRGKFTISARVKGSGLHSQLGAVVHGLARALVEFDSQNRILLKPSGLLTRDDRMKETRKVGMGGKARRKRQSPRR